MRIEEGIAKTEINQRIKLDKNDKFASISEKYGINSSLNEKEKKIEKEISKIQSRHNNETFVNNNGKHPVIMISKKNDKKPYDKTYEYKIKKNDTRNKIIKIQKLKLK